jgi:hypothetical protein
MLYPLPDRALFLALFRYIVALGQRGCWRTALEYTKFLLSLDDGDPVCSLLMVDMYAIRAREYHWLIRLFGACAIGLLQRCV